jgi:uncharacterized membrane protein SpoIIM required for sporulation
MAEALAAFVARRRPDWQALEALLAPGRRRSLEEVTALDAHYRRASADLALAQRRYAGTDVVRYLSQLCARAYRDIYRPRGARLAGLRRFYAVTFPALARRTLPSTALAAGLVALGVVLGAVTVWLHPDGVRLLVGAELRAYIDRRELWTDGALAHGTPLELAALIFTNNLRVAIGAFALGITAGVGTVALALYNGVHLGAVLAACAREGLAANLLEFMAAHGPVELSIICLAAGAGLHVGRAVLDPGEVSRGTALRAHARDGVQLLLGCAPFLVAIGVVEGFVSPGDYFPWPLKVLTGAATGVAFWRWLLRGGASAA